MATKNSVLFEKKYLVDRRLGSVFVGSVGDTNGDGFFSLGYGNELSAATVAPQFGG